LAMTGLPAAMAAAKSPPLTPLKAKGKLLGPKMTTGPMGAKQERIFFSRSRVAVSPGLFAHCGRGLAELVGGAGEFDVFRRGVTGEQSLLQRRQTMGGGRGFNVIGVGIEEGRDLRWVDRAEFGGCFGCSGEGGSRSRTIG